MNIVLIETYYTGSHKIWADNLKKYSKHEIRLFTMPGRFWKWRMEASAIEIAKRLENGREFKTDLILCSSMIDLALLRSLLPKTLSEVPLVYYLHENQLSYPVSQMDRRKVNMEMHYGFINYKSCLAADKCIFNSGWHLNDFCSAVEKLLGRLPDYKNLSTVGDIYTKSDVLPVGLSFKRMDNVAHSSEKQKAPVLLWNHRWEYDKNPEAFIKLCDDLAKQNEFFINFIGGTELSEETPDYILEFRARHTSRILNFGYVDDYDSYIRILKASDILPVTSSHDYFGISVLEAVYCGVTPLLPGEMVYSQHFPGQEEWFYKDFKELKSKCQRWIAEPASIPDNDLRDQLMKYDIENVAPAYDKLFSSLIT